MKKEFFGNIAKLVLGLCLIFASSFLVLTLKGKFILPISLVATFFTKGGTLAGIYTILYIVAGVCNIAMGFSEILDIVKQDYQDRSSIQ